MKSLCSGDWLPLQVLWHEECHTQDRCRNAALPRLAELGLLISVRRIERGRIDGHFTSLAIPGGGLFLNVTQLRH